MSKHPSKQKRARQFAAAFVILIALNSFTAHMPVRVFGQSTQTPQQQQQGAPQQRPRRVGSSPQTSPAPARELPRATPSPARAAAGAAGGEEVDEDDVVRVETQLITVPVTVTDRAGRTLTNLRAENFALYEDGQPQRVTNFITTDAPFEVALLLDTSGSTRAEVGLIRRAANAFIEALRPGDRISILAFNTQEDGATKLATVELLTHLTDDRDALRQAIESIGSSNGTPFYDALERVVTEVFREPPRANLRGRRALVALTDGVDSTSAADFAEVRVRLQQTGTLAYFIQVNTEEFVEERLMRDCQDDGRLSLSRVQLQRYR
ncbi:MAG TPA: VWA domain-containing protein, partial [Pyrinomonadaceae bacterium]|nr:VWA domain-containing protein [Pyrinomonadaceae bacterium]